MSNYIFDVYLDKDNQDFFDSFRISANDLNQALRLLTRRVNNCFCEEPVHWYVSRAYKTVSRSNRRFNRYLKYEFEGLS